MPKGKDPQMVLPPLRTSQGIHVPDLSGLRLRFAKHADEELTLSMGINIIYIADDSRWTSHSKRGVRHYLRSKFLDVYD